MEGSGEEIRHANANITPPVQVGCGTIFGIYGFAVVRK